MNAPLIIAAIAGLLFGGCVMPPRGPAPRSGEIIRRYFEEWANQGNTRAADELIATNLVLRHPHVTVQGLDAYKQSMASFHAAFPDLHFTIEDQVAQGDKVLVRWIMSGTQRGEFQGRSASGKAVAVAGMSLFRVQRGMIQEIWVNMDRLGFQEQLGWHTTPAEMATARNDRYFELRLYTVTSNKMDGVLERFRETVEPVRQKHGLKTLGYWTAPGATNGGMFVYLMTAASREELQRQEKEVGADPDFKKGYAASNEKHGQTVDRIVAQPLEVNPSAKFDFSTSPKPRAFELRLYSVRPGKLDTFRNRWRDHAVPIYERHGLHSVGWWIAEKKDADGQDQFVALLAGENFPAIQQSIRAFHADPEWQSIEKETERDGPLRSGVTAFPLTPADFSKLK